MIDETVAIEIGLTGYKHNLKLTGIGGKQHAFDATVSKVKISPVQDDTPFSQTIGLQIIKQPVGKVNHGDWNSQKENWSHIKDIDFPKLDEEKCQVKLLIGNDNCDLMRSIEERSGRENEPIARLTPLGWTAVGSVFKEQFDNVRDEWRQLSQSGVVSHDFCQFGAHTFGSETLLEDQKVGARSKRI
jgi:hypothetical protein